MTTPRDAYVPADEDVIVLFYWELEAWGKPNPAGFRRAWADPFLYAVCDGAAGHNGSNFNVTRQIYWAFETLDDLLASTAAEVAAIRGVGPKAMALLVAELDRRELKLAEVAS
jgi:hypothetical protein